MLNKKALTGTASAEPLFVDELFSTYLYTGNGSTQTITNGIDLAGEGGMVWIKSRSDAYNQWILDTNRGVAKTLFTDLTNAEANLSTGLTAFNANGFSIGDATGLNNNASTFASWTFRKAPKFFDVVTYTGNGVNGRTIAHNLGSVPGMIIVKRTSGLSSWTVYHRSLGASKFLILNDTFGELTASDRWNNTEPTSTNFSVGSIQPVNENGETYVAYLFAHDAGGFGDAGTDNIISCGSYTGNGTTGNTVTLGYEPQYVLIKRTDTAAAWILQDVMRGMSHTSLEYLQAQSSAVAENDGVGYVIPTATGFTLNSNAAWNASGGTYIYMAIRRPMKKPTSGTEVFSPNKWTSTTGSTITTNFPVDMQIGRWMGGEDNNIVQTRLIGLNSTTTNGNQPYLITNTTNAEQTVTAGNYGFNNTGFLVGNNNTDNGWSVNFRRAKGFFDVVCYTGTGSATNINHNLGVAPELMIVKNRNTANYQWYVYLSSQGSGKTINLSEGNAVENTSFWNSTNPTSSVFSVSSAAHVNGSGNTYVAYLFASLDGVSKVGSYTGNGSSQTINCGFSAGARFVLIKRTDDLGDWVTFDSARGIVSGNDPALYLNSSAAEVTTIDGIDPDNSGFVVNQESTLNLNVNGASYIFLAIS